MEKIYIKLAEGKSLFKPGTRILLKENTTHKVDNTTFWRRRIKDGDVTIHTPTTPEKTGNTKNKNLKSGDK